MARFAAGEIAAKDLDLELVEAGRRDVLSTASAAFAAEASLRSPAGRKRRGSFLTLAGRVSFDYNYAGKGRGVKHVFADVLGGGGWPRATQGARLLVAKASALLDSFAQACGFLGQERGMPISVPGARALTMQAGAKTAEAWSDRLPELAWRAATDAIERRNREASEAALAAAGVVESAAGRKPRPHPRGSRHVGLTMAISPDGTGAPCTHADTGGVKGKDGKEAHTREVKVLAVTFYDRVDRRGRPIVNRNCIVYFSSAAHADEFAPKACDVIRRMGYGRCERVQFVSDGAEWLEKMYLGGFDREQVVRAVDFSHAAQYLHVLVGAVCGGDAGDAFRRFRKTLKRKGWSRTLAEIKEEYGERALASLPEEAAKALAYLERRKDAMEYGRYRDEGYYIGSGTVESGCKSVVAARCKLAGMHWRLEMAGAVALLRATLRSNLPIAA